MTIKNTVVKGLCCGYDHAGFWDFQGKAYTWGNPLYGKLGHPSPSGMFVSGDLELKPRMIQSLSGKQVVCMALGSRFTIILDSLGKLMSIGYLRPLKNSSYASESDMGLIVPVDLPADVGGTLNRDTKFVKVAAGDEHCLASDGIGRLYSWGFSADGALGTVAETIKFPTQIKDLDNCGVVDFACGKKFSIAIVNPNGTDLDEKIYTDFRYSRVESIKFKLTTVDRKAKKVLSSRPATAAVTGAPTQSPKKLSVLDINKMVDKYLDHTDLDGFAGLRQEGKALWVKDLVNQFFTESMTGEQFNIQHKKLQDLCQEMGINFEKLFYDKVMSDPIVKAQTINQENAFKGINVAEVSDTEGSNVRGAFKQKNHGIELYQTVAEWVHCEI